jgi:dihydrofolate reductase/thymidylate synthase
MYQRAQDLPVGSPFNIASYSFLTHLLAKHCGLVAHEFVYFGGNGHIYEPHVDAVKMQLQRTPYPFPTVSIKQVRNDINDYTVDDFVVENYVCHDIIKMQMVA